MKTEKYAHLLDAAVSDRVPDTLNLAPRILASVQSSAAAHPRRPLKLAATLALVLLAALVFTTAAYAVYRWMADPGLQSVQDAGLVNNVDVTAQPTLQPTATPTAQPQPAVTLNLSQEQAGVTLTLDWVYLDEGRLALGWHSSGLPDGATLQEPRITFQGANPQQAQGSSQNTYAEGNRSVYVSYQVIHADEVAGEVSLGVDVPLVQWNAGVPSSLAQFHFDIQPVPVYRGQAPGLQRIYTARNNGIEVRLEAVRVSPSGTQVTLCYTFPGGDDRAWQADQAVAQLGAGAEEQISTRMALEDVEGSHCEQLGFAAGNAGGDTHLALRIERFSLAIGAQEVLSAERIDAANRELAPYGIEIQSAALDQSEGPGGWRFVRQPEAGLPGDAVEVVQHALQEKLEGRWEFVVELPTADVVPGVTVPTPTPIPPVLYEQNIAGVMMSLDWVFADAKRVAFGYTISGLPDNPDALALSGDVVVSAGNGPILGSMGTSSSVEHVTGHPGTVSGTWSALLDETYLQNSIRLSIDLTLDGSAGYDYNHIIANFPLAYQAPAFPADYVPQPYPAQQVGTFHFEAEAPVYPLQVFEPGLSVTSNDIEMRLEKIEMTPSYAMIYLCYRKPTSADWMIGSRTRLHSSDYEAGLSGYLLLGDTDYGFSSDFPDPRNVAGATGGRCVGIDFLLGYTGQSDRLTLVIPSLEQSVPEVIPDNEIQIAREKLHTQGIEMDYSTFSAASGGGGGGPVFNQLPAGMDAQQAYQLFLNALGYAQEGPWVFEIEVP